jgi:hypothetical protein
MESMWLAGQCSVDIVLGIAATVQELVDFSGGGFG